MGFDIPEPYVWDESFKTFYDKIDEEHRGLFKGIFNCINDRGNAATLDQMRKVFDHHFKEEEAMMKKANYSDHDSHKKAHDDFLKKLGTFKCPLDDGSLNHAKEWLVNHIKVVDFKYKNKL